MRAEYINPLIVSLVNICRDMTGTEIQKANPHIRSNPLSINEVAIMIGITGDLKGQLMLSFKEETAKRIVSKMMMGTPVLELDELSKSAISELGNMIAGNYATGLSGYGLQVDITTPTVIKGNNIEISLFNKKQLSIPFISDIGEITVDISITELS